jgi:hypothetical protein
MSFDPTTNRIPYGLLTPEEQATLKAWPHGWEYYSLMNGAWARCDPRWDEDVVYRGKPAPKVTSYWFNLYDGDRIGNIWTSQAAASYHANYEGSIMRMQICNGEVTVTKET